jgi:hypothetical protein
MAQQPSRLKGMLLLSTIINKDAHWKIKILNRWPSIAGEFAKHVVINRIEDETLFLEAAHPMWAQEAQGYTDVFIEKITEVCGAARITKIVVRGCKTARTQRAQDSGKPQATQRTLFSEPEKAPSIELTSAERSVLSAISHKKLSSSMAEFYQQCKRRSFLTRQNRDREGETHGVCHRPHCYCPQRHNTRSTSS